MKKLIYLFLLSFVFSNGQSLQILDQLRLEQTAPQSSLLLNGLVLLIDESSIDATATTEGDLINTWDDLSGSANNATQTGTPRPLLHINSQNKKQVRFGTNSSWLNLGQPSNLNFVGGTDEFTVIIKIGDNPQSTGYIVSKADANGADRQWGIFNNAGRMGSVVRGTNSWGDQVNHTMAANDLIIWTVSTTIENVSVNDTQTLTDYALVGTSTHTTADVNIGGRSNGSFLNDGDVQFVAVYNRVLTAQEITYIKTEYKVN